MKKLISIGAILLGLLVSNVKADDSCVRDADLRLDGPGISSMAWVGAPNLNFTVVSPTEWTGAGMLSSGQPCSYMTGPILNVFMSAPVTSDTVVGSITITCQLGMIHSVQSMSIPIIMASGSQFSSYQFFVCQCVNGCAVCICRNGQMQYTPAPIGPPPPTQQ